MSYQLGDRVGAIESADDETVRLYGYGVYLGEEVPPAGIQLWGLDLCELGHRNPKIQLDGGKVVWGCECWWGSEAKIKQSIGKRKVICVDIDESRNRAR